jgi:hypothetical protein
MRMPFMGVALVVGAGLAAHPLGAQEDRWTGDFRAAGRDWTTTGRNPYFVLEPGYALVLEHGDERLVITVLSKTRTVDDVETRVVEERETKRGSIVEVSRNFFAMDRSTNSVFYFGEEVDDYEGGEIVGHAGAWQSGRNDARFGLMMPGLPLLGARYYQEIAPKVAMDRAEIVSLGETVKTPAGEFRNVLKIAETTPLEPRAREFKYYATGIGLIQDGDLKLVKYGRQGEG